MRIELKQVGLLAIAVAVGACSSAGGSGPSNNGQGGGTQSTKGGGSGTSGGTNGSGQGGSNSNSPQGGNNGSAQGGGSNSGQGGGNSTGQGGGSSSNGGSSNGGNSNTANGGSNNNSNGGSSNSAGNGSSSGGMTSTGNTPPGYWSYKDWHGCVWTGVDTVTVAPHKSTIMPTDFTMQSGTTYHVSGTVGQDPKYQGTALLGFNLNQPAEGANCTYNPAAATSDGPPEVAFASGSAGIAVNFSKTGATGVVRIQIQGQKGATDANNRWCYTLTQTQGKDFAPFNRFFTQCWNDDGTGKAKTGTDADGGIGKAYNGEKISAIVFNVPGDSAKDLPFDFTVNGFALGNSAADAPDGGTLGSLSGTIGGADSSGSTDHDFQRVKVNAGGHSYVIQNNNWGNPSGTEQTISYKDNSFTITGMVGGDPGGGSVRSFPSIFIGSNGNTMNGAYSTYNDDSLPKKVSAIQSVQTTLKWGGGVGGGNYNVSYDVWFGPTPAAKFPFYSEYKDGQSGFIMVWLYKPGQNNPIGGSPAASNRTVAGVSGTWNVYAGPRGGSGPNSGVPVISYVATSTQQSMTFDLNNFIKDAVTTGAGGLKINSEWYLTDVFAGFEIWNGNDAKGLSVQEFTAVVK